MKLRVAIVGRPNVGKSTLFNRIVGKKLAITDKAYGVTRDHQEGHGKIGDLDFTIIDTAGLETSAKNDLEIQIKTRTMNVIGQSNLVIFLIDARAGLTPLDEYFARILREQDIPVVLVANKCEAHKSIQSVYESYKLGFGEPALISAEHGIGLDQLYSLLQPFANSKNDINHDQTTATNPSRVADIDNSSTIQIAIVGRPNVGKSTLVNRIIGDERQITGPEPGITRDSIRIEIQFKDQNFCVIDTAGLRKKAKIEKHIESFSANNSYRSIQYSQLVVLVLDGRTMLEKQDLTIARQIIEEGRILLIVVNKWDIVEEKKSSLRNLENRLQTSLPQIKGIPIVKLSALTGQGTENLLPTALKYFDIWNNRVSTSKLNQWLRAAINKHPPPLINGRRPRLKYITQAKSRPPTFVLFSGGSKSIPEDFRRYLINDLRKEFSLNGTPIRLIIREGNNPYSRQ